eukprot:TRINITY_DN16950_c0_g2_i1.p1 TRINITY_DN16950_c0_g2~~TRINITY_DN16950_c0_g2_i1.p1  ORF type:complete len:454 (-),score=95.38 TRINITY_DN16950_c0_g2_i1:82-1443(-)
MAHIKDQSAEFRGNDAGSKDTKEAEAQICAQKSCTDVALMMSKLDESAAEVIDDAFICPITFEIMRDPVVTADGHSYERLAIKEWFKLDNKESPRTNIRLASTTLIGNTALKKAIQAWIKRPRAAPTGEEEDRGGYAQDDGSADPNESLKAAAKKGKKKKKKKGNNATQEETASPEETTSQETAGSDAFYKALCCPLSAEIMSDPVLCFVDSQTYEREAIEEKLARVQTSTNPKPSVLVPNHQLRQVAQVWLELSSAGKNGDNRDEGGTATKSKLEVLMADAFSRALKSQEKEELISQLGESQDVLRSGLTPARLGLLVEHNPPIAIECLVKLAMLRHLPQYLTSLVAMSMSLQSIEVVFRLIHAIEVPQKFIRAFYLKCIRACSEMKHNSENQTRTVRLLCAFLQGVLKSKKFDVSTCLPELQAFCIEFSAVKEAGSCHRMLRALEQSNAFA